MRDTIRMLTKQLSRLLEGQYTSLVCIAAAKFYRIYYSVFNSNLFKNKKTHNFYFKYG